MDNTSQYPSSNWRVNHTVQFYEDEFLCSAVAEFLSVGLLASQPLLIIATPSHGEIIAEVMEGHGIDVQKARADGRLIIANAHEALSTFMVDGKPDPELFRRQIGALISNAKNALPAETIRAYVELANILCEEGNSAAAVRLETLWNEVAIEHSVSLLCGYRMGSIYKQVHWQHLDDICRLQTAVVGFNRPLIGDGRRLPTGDSATPSDQSGDWPQQAIEMLSQDISEGERRFRDLINDFPAAVYTTDAEGRLTYFNPAAAEFSGRVPELGTDQWCVSWKLFRLDGTPLPHEQCPMAVALKEGRRVRGEEAIAERPDGKRVSFMPYPTPLWDADGKIVGGINILLDTTEQRRAEETRARLAAIVEWSDDAIIGKNLNGIITSWNRGAERLFGYTAEEAIGRPVTMLMPPDRVSEEPDILERLRRGECIDHYETIRRCKDGTLRDISLSVSPIFANGQLVGASKIARDITGRKRAERERERLLAQEQFLRAEAEAANRAKDEFLAIVSHELRTPLTPILMWIHMLKSGKDLDKLPDAMESIERNVALQQRLIEDLLDLSRVKAGKMSVEMAEHDIQAVVRSAAENISRDAENRGITIEFSGENMPMRGQADAARLQQVFANILGNAVKFTPTGGAIRVSIAQDDNKAILKFRDTGEGIAPEFLPHVFDMFCQQEESTRRSHPGLGIGLALAHNLIELHRGTIKVHSDGHGKGTEVTVTLPLVSDRKFDSSEKAGTRYGVAPCQLA